jgi:hypothetical protein
MSNLRVRQLAVCMALLTGVARAAWATEVVIGDAKSQPESMAVGPDGVVYAGSSTSPYVYKLMPGAATAEKFVDVSSEPAGTTFLGVLVEAGTNTLWTCQVTAVASVTPVQRHSALRGFDLKTGAPKVRWNLPGESNLCNDLAVGPDKALYITDTPNAKIYKLPAGSSTGELFTENRALTGIDGITFMDGVMYVTNVYVNNIYRVPVDASGKAGAPVDIWMDEPIKGPDGMRAEHGKLFIAENSGGRISYLTVNGDKAHVTVVREGLRQPTGIEPAGDTLWFTERMTGKVMSVPMPK